MVAVLLASIYVADSVLIKARLSPSFPVFSFFTSFQPRLPTFVTVHSVNFDTSPTSVPSCFSSTSFSEAFWPCCR